MKIFCTGSAGFIGSHVVDALIKRGHEVTVFDNLSTGRKEWVNPKARLVQGHCWELVSLDGAMAGCEAVFHFQGNADVKGGVYNTHVDFNQNAICTHRVLDAAKKANIKHFVFASSAAVYGEPDVYPTPETYAGNQTSLYGASKLAGEAMVQAYSNYYGMRHLIFRFVSWIGPRYSHGVIFDFVKKLKANPNRLEILGDGKQMKSYLHVSDGVNGIMKAFEADAIGTYNLGHNESISVSEVACIICEELLLNPVVEYTGGERGWKGDSPIVHLDTRKIEQLGWVRRVSIDEGIRLTVKHLMDNPHLLERK